MKFDEWADQALPYAISLLRRDGNGSRVRDAGWRILSVEEALSLSGMMNRRYPGRMVVSVARRDDSDDVICLVFTGSGSNYSPVLQIHDFAAPGWEVVAEFSSLEDWMDGLVVE